MFKHHKAMMQFNKIKLIVTIVWICSLLLLSSNTSIYAQSSQAAGITITPATQNLLLESQQSSFRATLMLTNHTNERATLEITAQDFGADDDGSLLFLGTSPNDKWDEHRLAKWITITPKKVKLEPEEQAEVALDIRNDSSLAPGGHYAGILATVESKEEKSFVSINQSISSLLFINKVGGESYSIQAENLSPQSSWWGQVERVTTKLANTGNTHIIPRGTLILSDPFNRPIAAGIINQSSTALLPGTDSNFKTSLKQSSPPLWPGMYTLVLAYRYDGQDEVYTTQQKIFTLGIVATTVIILLGTAGLAWLLKRLAPRFRHTS